MTICNYILIYYIIDGQFVFQVLEQCKAKDWSQSSNNNIKKNFKQNLSTSGNYPSTSVCKNVKESQVEGNICDRESDIVFKNDESSLQNEDTEYIPDSSLNKEERLSNW